MSGLGDGAGRPRGRRERLAHLAGGSRLLGVVGRLRSALRPDLRIVAYHRVLPTAARAALEFDHELASASVEGFRAQVRHLARHYRPMTLGAVSELLDAGRGLDPRTVVVTFDDGYDDNHTHAFPVLREFGVPATFFVATAHVASGEPYAYDWLAHAVLRGEGRLTAPELGIDELLPASPVARRDLVARLLDRLKGLAQHDQQRLIESLPVALGVPRAASHPQCRPMDWTALRAMAAAGMEIGSHGATHRMLGKLGQEELVAELSGSKSAIEQALGRPVVSLSYPVGGPDAFDARVIEAARAAGYRIACSYVTGVNPAAAPARFALHRLPIEWCTTESMFAAMLALPEVFCYPTRVRAAAPG